MEISIDPASVPDLNGKELAPGMPVTVLIKTGIAHCSQLHHRAA